MKYPILLLIAVCIVGCASTDPGKPVDFIPVYVPLAQAKTSVQKAKINAADIDKNGAQAGSPVVKELVQNVDDTDKALDQTKAALDTAKADSDAKTAAAAQARAHAEAIQNHWKWFFIGGVVFMVLLVMFAPLIVAAAGSGVAAFITKIPIIGGFTIFAEEAAAGVAGIMFLLSLMGLGKLFGIL